MEIAVAQLLLFCLKLKFGLYAYFQHWRAATVLAVDRAAQQLLHGELNVLQKLVHGELGVRGAATILGVPLATQQAVHGVQLMLLLLGHQVVLLKLLLLSCGHQCVFC